MTILDIRFMNKRDEIFDLLKVPDSAIIKQLKVEIGKLQSYIQELEDSNKWLKQEVVSMQIELDKEEAVLEKQIYREVKKEEKRQEYREQIKKQVKDLIEKNKLLKSENVDLSQTIAQLLSNSQSKS